MKAIVCTRYGPPEVLQLQEMAKPAPRDHEICLKIVSTSVTASDCIIRAFNVPAKFKIPMALAIGLRKPRVSVLGMVFAGEVESVGKKTHMFKKGDHVYGIDRFRFGGYAEYKCIREDGVLAIKPARISFGEAAAIPYGGLLALHFLKKSNLQSGQKIAVYGASGAIGSSAVQLARHFGAEVTGICSTANVEMVRALGAHNVVDYTKEDFTEKGERYDVIFNAVGKAKAHLRCNQALAPGGKPITVDDGSPRLLAEDLIGLNQLVEQGQLKAVIDRSYTLEQMAEAHRYVDTGRKKGNVIIHVVPQR